MNALSPHQLRLQTLLRGWQPETLPTGLQREAHAPGVWIDMGHIRSPLGPVQRARDCVTVYPSSNETGRLARAAFESSRWTLRQEPTADAPDYQLLPPSDFADRAVDFDADRVWSSAVGVFFALSALMRPGLDTPRVVRILSHNPAKENDRAIEQRNLQEVAKVLAACQGLGLGEVHIDALDERCLVDTSVPLFVGAHLLTNPTAHRQLAKTMLDYMQAVMLHGTPPFRFHLCAFQDDAAGRTEQRVSDQSIEEFLRIMADDPRMVSGSGGGVIAAVLGGVLLIACGAGSMILGDAPAGYATTPWSVASVAGGALVTFGADGVRRMLDKRSVRPPSITTDYRLDVWPTRRSDDVARYALFRNGRIDQMTTETVSLVPVYDTWA